MTRLTWCLAGLACLVIVAIASPLANGAKTTQVSRTNPNPGNATLGKPLFVAFCGKCHTFAAAGSRGTLGPDLDQDKIDFTTVVTAVEEGVGGIQAEYVLRDITFAQVYDIAKYVAQNRTGPVIGGSEGNP